MPLGRELRKPVNRNVVHQAALARRAAIGLQDRRTRSRRPLIGQSATLLALSATSLGLGVAA